MKWWLLSKAVESMAPTGPSQISKLSWSRGFFRVWVLLSAIWAMTGGAFVALSNTGQDVWAYWFGDIHYELAVRPDGTGRFALRDPRKYQQDVNSNLPSDSIARWTKIEVRWPSAVPAFETIRDELLEKIWGPAATLSERRDKLAALSSIATRIAASPQDISKFTPSEQSTFRGALADPEFGRILIHLQDERDRQKRDNAAREIELRRQFHALGSDDVEKRARAVFDWIHEDREAKRGVALTDFLQAIALLAAVPLGLLLFGLAIQWVAKGFTSRI